jgi:hypothetical protein
MLKAGLIGFGGPSLYCVGSVAIGWGDAHQLELFATWISLLAGIACLCRSPIHVFWGGYLTRHPRGSDDERQALIGLNILVPANFLLSASWIWISVDALAQPAPHPPLFLALAIPIAVVFVAVATVACVKETGKRRGTEIVCEGPIGKWFRKFFKASSPITGVLHKVLEFLRYPNSPKVVSRFLCLLAALMFIPIPVHSSATAGERLNQAISSSHAPIIGEDRPHVQPDESAESGIAEGGGKPGLRAWCRGVYDAAPAPTLNREQIELLFEEEGTREAGCPGAAEAVSGQRGVWVAPAYCGAELRSLAVTAPADDYLPALLYQQAAAFARARGREGLLLGSSTRHPVRGGDFYIVDTVLGSFVLIRRRSSSGRLARARRGDLPCESYGSGNFVYTVVPPGLVPLWLDAAEEEDWLFPRSTSASGEGDRFEFLAEYPATEKLASASCSSDLICTLWKDGEARQSSGYPSHVAVADITSLAG